MTSPKSQTPVHVEYRNATFYGQINSEYKRNGKGLIILDTSTVLFADWKDNQIEGMYIYLTDGIRAYGNMINGKLQGYNIICTTSTYSGNGQSGHYSNQAQNKIRTFYGTFRNNKIYGRGILVDNDSIMICQYNNNQLQQIMNKRTLRDRDLYDILRDVFPNNIYTLDEYLTAFIKNFISQLQTLQQISRYEPCVNYFSKQSDQKFYGFQDISNPSKKFGILMMDNQLISVGQHNNNQLQGIGRLYNQDHIYDGAFRNGQIDGIGIDFHRNTNKFVLEIHDGTQDRVEKGFGFPLREILEYRKEFHLRSIYFYNDLVVLNLKGRMENLIGFLFIGPKRPTNQSHNREFKQFKQNQRQRRYTASSRSGSKRIQNSPLRERLSRYQMESDIIQDNDNSPIKNRPNQYRPVDRTSNYFRERQVSVQRDKSRNQGRFTRPLNGRNQDNYYDQDGKNSRSRNFNQTMQNHASNRSQDRFQDRSNDRFGNNSRNKFQQRQQRQREMYNQIVRQQTPTRTYGHPPQPHSQSGSNYYNNQGQPANRNRKHTKDLVKELQNQQKQRRLTLDQIYSKSNLYKRGK